MSHEATSLVPVIEKKASFIQWYDAADKNLFKLMGAFASFEAIGATYRIIFSCTSKKDIRCFTQASLDGFYIGSSFAILKLCSSLAEAKWRDNIALQIFNHLLEEAMNHVSLHNFYLLLANKIASSVTGKNEISNEEFFQYIFSLIITINIVSALVANRPNIKALCPSFFEWPSGCLKKTGSYGMKSLDFLTGLLEGGAVGVEFLSSFFVIIDRLRGVRGSHSLIEAPAGLFTRYSIGAGAGVAFGVTKFLYPPEEREKKFHPYKWASVLFSLTMQTALFFLISLNINSLDNPYKGIFGAIYAIFILGGAVMTFSEVRHKKETHEMAHETIEEVSKQTAKLIEHVDGRASYLADAEHAAFFRRRFDEAPAVVQEVRGNEKPTQDQVLPPHDFKLF